MKQNYVILLLVLTLGFTSKAQIVLVDQPAAGTQGIVSDFIGGTVTASGDDFVLTDSFVIETISASGFAGGGTSSLDGFATAIDIYIYADTPGSPNSNPTSAGTALLEITNLALPNAAISIDDDPSTTDIVESNITIDVTAANGSEFTLTAGTYWLVITPRVPDDSNRWNWSQSNVGNNAVIFDEGNFGAGFDWTPIVSLVPGIDSLAMNISGTMALSVDEFSINAVDVYPNPVNDILTIEVTNTELTSIKLYSILGEQVYNGTNERSIDMSELNSGVYLLRLSDANGTLTKRIIKQ